MIRHLIPCFDWGGWGGAALTHDGSRTGDDVQGGCIVVQWFGVVVEIAIGTVR